jgi:hypothetical protein
MILSVLSGERPVTEVVDEAKISRATYYQWETKALKAILSSLQPGATGSEETGASQKLRALEEKVARLEREKRRVERLLLLTRQVVKSAPVVSGLGRPPKRGRRSSMRSGTKSSPAPSKITAPSPAPSIPTPASETGR